MFVAVYMDLMAKIPKISIRLCGRHGMNRYRVDEDAYFTVEDTCNCSENVFIAPSPGIDEEQGVRGTQLDQFK